ncbi:hypothetical protein BGZ83_003131 [Gryganskiella cystojenkinii]|nr:hypothetical protein BGZ83_003131 [Gryganskiella cystojenkinii]
MSTPPAKTIAGIQQKEDDVRVIPMTRRPDGTYRKERKIRPGYTPPEDVAKYTNTILSANRPAPAPVASSTTPSTPKTKTQLKNEKRKAKRKEETTGSEPGQEESNGIEASSTDATATTETTTSPKDADTPASTTPVDMEKKLRALNKKLRQVEQLKEKQDKGETLLPEQQEKVSKLDELLAQIAELSI